jgi:hypothetical protein
MNISKTEYFVKVSNRKTYDSLMLNLKGKTVISAEVWSLLSFCNTSREGSVIYPIFFLVILHKSTSNSWFSGS